MSERPDRAELIEFLNSLLEAERAGTKAARLFHKDHGDSEAANLIDTVFHDEAWCCGMLSGRIEELGGQPTEVTGDFFEKVAAKEGLEARLSFLNRGQEWVVRKLEEIIPTLPSGGLRDDLAEMLRRHHVNIADCDRYLEQP